VIRKTRDWSHLYLKAIRTYSKIPYGLGTGRTLPPLNAFFEVTYACNLRCHFCQFLQFQEDGEFPRTEKDELSLDEIRTVIEGLPRYTLLSFSGGEPFMKKGFLDLLEWACRRNKVHIFTNANFITDEVARKLVAWSANSLVDKGLVLLSVSLEGTKATHDGVARRKGAFERSTDAIRSIVAHRGRRKFPLVEMKTVMTVETLHDLKGTFQLARRIGVDVFNLMTLNMLPHASRITESQGELPLVKPTPPVPPMNLDLLRATLLWILDEARRTGPRLRFTPQGITFEEILLHYENRFPLDRYRCYAPWSKVDVTAHGEVLLCPYIIVGNVREAPLEELRNNAIAKHFRSELRKVGVFPGCVGCCFLEPHPARPPADF